MHIFSLTMCAIIFLRVSKTQLILSQNKLRPTDKLTLPQESANSCLHGGVYSCSSLKYDTFFHTKEDIATGMQQSYTTHIF